MTFPTPRFRQKLSALFGKSAEELGFVSESRQRSEAVEIATDAGARAIPLPPDPPDLWSVPYPRNPFFTGREEILQRLHETLNPEHAAALTQPLAISGLGGIGKTQIVLEYAYMYRRDYRYVFWTNAATSDSLLADFMRIADLLQLPEKNERDQNRVLLAVRAWFATHRTWLLILDNADDLAIIRDFVPLECPGHLVLTSRAQALGSLAERIELEEMGMAEGTLFLLHRARLLAPGALLDRASAEQLVGAEAIVIEMAFLPLALDQAGAYIDEVGCDLSTYLDLYRTRRQELLQRRGQLPTDYPASVATTWSLSFQKVEQANPAAAELLRLCAFLEPDTIPEDLLSEGSAALGPPLQQAAKQAFTLNKALEELRRFSLVQRNPATKTLRVHRLVQIVLKDAMKRGTRRRWAERAVRATHTVFPQKVGLETWPRCLRYLGQAQACAVLIQEYTFAFVEAASLLQRTALYLRAHALYAQAELLYRQALRIWEQALGLEHPDAAHALNGLAILYREQAKFEQAEALYQRTLRIREQALGPEHNDVAVTLHNLADLYKEQGKYAQAEPLHRRAVRIWEQTMGPEHPDIAHSLNGLANLYREQGKDEQAEPIYWRALHIWEQAMGPDYLYVTYPLNNLADLSVKQGKYEQAESLYLRALRLREQHLGPEHPGMAYPLNGLADLSVKQGKYEQAEAVYQRVLRIWERATGPEHPAMAHALSGLANVYGEQGKDEQAESLYLRALSIWERTLGPEHPESAETLHDYAVFQHARGHEEEAAALYERALAIREQKLGSQHPKTAATRTAYTELLQAMDQS